jgi:RNA polymerase sigma-70 factor (ECF subfamily)
VHRDEFRTGALVRPWVYTIARNLARNRRRRGRIVGWLSLGTVEHEPRIPGPDGSRDEVERRVATALAALPERQREACSLRLVDELSLEEIARVTGTSVGTVKSRLFYGQRRLRELLEDLR